MTRTHATFNPMHLGDNLVHLHFLRALAKAHPDHHFTHGAPDQHLAQLYPLWQDLANLTVVSLSALSSQLSATPPLNTWRGDLGHWYHHPKRNDFAAYHLEFFASLAERMGLLSPFKTPADLLFDYPALQSPSKLPPADFLIINSSPRSGQWAGFSEPLFDSLVTRLSSLGKQIITTAPISGACIIPCTSSHNLDVTSIGVISQHVKCIIGCVTGPMWPCLNVWNSETPNSKPQTPNSSPLRIHLLDAERVELCANTVHANSLSLVPEILRDRGLL